MGGKSKMEDREWRMEYLVARRVVRILKNIEHRTPNAQHRMTQGRVPGQLYTF